MVAGPVCQIPFNITMPEIPIGVRYRQKGAAILSLLTMREYINSFGILKKVRKNRKISGLPTYDT